MTEIDLALARSRTFSYCQHCGNLTHKLKKGTCWRTVEDIEEYQLLQCEVCLGASLVRLKGRDDKPVPRPSQQLWPPLLTLSPEAPTRVREIYKEARSVMKRSPNSFVVQIGRALEAVTKDRGTQGRNLYQRLEGLVKEGHLPEIFGEMTHITRTFRNWGAHDADIDVTSQDVEMIDEFFKAIIEYLYVAPDKVSKVQALIERKTDNL